MMGTTKLDHFFPVENFSNSKEQQYTQFGAPTGARVRYNLRFYFPLVQIGFIWEKNGEIWWILEDLGKFTVIWMKCWWILANVGVFW